jgi:phosphate transport system substrate-binding protein
MHTKQDKPQNAAEVLRFFEWAYMNGGKLAEELDYVPMPESVSKLVEAAWKTNIKDASGKAVWN